VVAQTDTPLYVGEQLFVGRFDCDAGHPLWSSDNRSGPWPLLAFPGTPVEITQAGHRKVVATSNQVMLYNGNQLYRRRIIDPRGDHCVFIAVEGRLAAEIAAAADPAFRGHEGQPFTTAWAPTSPHAVLGATLLVRYLESVAPAAREPLAIDESLLGLLHTVLAGADAPRPRSRPRAAARHAEQARALEHTLAQSFREARSLQALAEGIGISPFHAARVFREHTGLSIHQYRLRLRLQAALHRLGDASDLTELALDVGFGSHSHFTEAFHRAFGAPPSHWRDQLARSRLQELTLRLWRPRTGPGSSTISKARARARR
jgi:AraC-like DNA-binding protein